MSRTTDDVVQEPAGDGETSEPAGGGKPERGPARKATRGCFGCLTLPVRVVAWIAAAILDAE